jgi:hypothetical protein
LIFHYILYKNFEDMQSVIPAQRKGVKSDTRYSVRLPNEAAARSLFQNARLNLLNVNSWHSLAGSGAVFQLVNEQGQEVNKLVETGNYFRITLPGVPGLSAGDGDEWVRVEKVEEGSLKSKEFTAIRVRPSAPPFVHKTQTAHFFSETATSTFTVMRKRNRVYVLVSGRNEVPNTKVNGVFAWLRNVVVAFAAMLGFNKPQWSNLAKGIARTKGAVLRVV